MVLPIRLIRWFNHAWPWPVFKRSLSDWASRRLGTSRGPQVYAGVLGRWKMRLDLANDAQRQMYLNSHQLTARRILKKVLRRGDVYVDCGAGVGYLSLHAAGLVGPEGRVHAFEPMPPTAERLRENVRLNDVANIEVTASGTWDSPKTATLYAFGDEPACPASLAIRDDNNAERQYTVQTVRLDDVVDPPIRAIRLDAAGAELATLRGAEQLLTASRPHVLISLDTAACEPFSHQPIDLVNWLMKRLSDHTPHLLEGAKCLQTDWAQLRDLLRADPRQSHTVWLSPPKA